MKSTRFSNLHIESEWNHGFKDGYDEACRNAEMTFHGLLGFVLNKRGWAKEEIQDLFEEMAKTQGEITREDVIEAYGEYAFREEEESE